MKYNRLGRTGLFVSELCLGTMTFGGRGEMWPIIGQLDQAAAATLLRLSIDAGINFFDTARMYGGGKSEEFLGAAVKSRRSEVIIATKFGAPTGPDHRNGARDNVMKEVEESLTALDSDYIDLYQMHYADPGTPIEVTLEALNELVTQGKVRYVGCSNFTGWQIADADWVAQTKGLAHFISLQNEWSLLARGIETEVVGACERFGLGVLPYFALAKGFLTGKYRPGEQIDSPRAEGASVYVGERGNRVLAALGQVAEAHGVPLPAVALRWLADQPTVVAPIASGRTVEQLADLLPMQDLVLTDEQRRLLTDASA